MVAAPVPALEARAGFVPRAAAFALDLALLSVASWAVFALMPPGPASLVDLLLGTGYYVLLEGGASGQTLGKRLLGVRVYDVGYRGAIGYERAALRLLGRVPSTIAAGLGYLWMLWDPERQTWHDRLAHSIVIPDARLSG